MTAKVFVAILARVWTGRSTVFVIGNEATCSCSIRKIERDV